MKKLIVGVTGQARAGKDTIAQWMATEFGYVRIGLADPMKRFCQEVFQFSDAQLYGDEKEIPDKRYPRTYFTTSVPSGEKTAYPQAGTPGFLTPRYALQTLGTEWGRDCYQDTWIDYGVRTAQAIIEHHYGYTAKHGLILHHEYPGPAGVVFSDLRFMNEFEAVKKAGGIVIRVKRASLGDKRVGIQGHASEEEQNRVPDSYFDAIVYNSEEGNLAPLFKQVEQVLAKTVVR